MRDLPTAEKTPTPANGARGSDCAESDFFIGRAYSIAKIYNIMYSRPRAACGSGFFVIENHAIVAWFKRG